MMKTTSFHRFFLIFYSVFLLQEIWDVEEKKLPIVFIPAMFEKITEKLWSYWNEAFYMVPFAVICQLIALITGLVFYKREKHRNILLFYVLTSIMSLTIGDYLLEYFTINEKDRTRSGILIEKKEMLFGLIEFFSFYIYFRAVFRGKKIVQWMPLFSTIIIFMAAKFFMLAYQGASIAELLHISFLFSAAEMLFLSVLCLFYFIELFRKEPVYRLTQRPSFWIASGLLFFSTLVIPFFLIAVQLPSSSYIFNYGFTVHLFLFSTLFLFLSKAFSLKKNFIC